MSIFRNRKYRLDGVGEFHQSGAYHRYFEGWAEYEALNKKGKVRIQRVYTGDYYCVDISRGMWNLLRSALWFLVIMSLTVFVIGAVQNTVQNQSPLLAVLQVIVAGGYVAAFFGLSSLRKQMTTYEYKSGPRALNKSCITTAIASASCFIVTIVLSIAQKYRLTGNAEEISLICFAVSTLIPIVVWLIMHRLPIQIRENETNIPDGSVIIRKPGE